MISDKLFSKIKDAVRESPFKTTRLSEKNLRAINKKFQLNLSEGVLSPLQEAGSIIIASPETYVIFVTTTPNGSYQIVSTGKDKRVYEFLSNPEPWVLGIDYVAELLTTNHTSLKDDLFYKNKFDEWDTHDTCLPRTQYIKNVIKSHINNKQNISESNSSLLLTNEQEIERTVPEVSIPEVVNAKLLTKTQIDYLNQFVFNSLHDFVEENNTQSLQEYLDKCLTEKGHVDYWLNIMKILSMYFSIEGNMDVKYKVMDIVAEVATLDELLYNSISALPSYLKVDDEYASTIGHAGLKYWNDYVTIYGVEEIKKVVSDACSAATEKEAVRKEHI